MLYMQASAHVQYTKQFKNACITLDKHIIIRKDIRQVFPVGSRSRLRAYTAHSYIYTSIKNNYKKLKGKEGWSTKEHTNKGSKDGNKGQGSSLLLFVLSLWLFIYQTLQIVFE